MAKTRYLEFFIHLTDRAVVQNAQAEFSTGILMSPDAASLVYNAPIQEYDEAFSAPCVRSPWFWFTPAANYPRNVSGFTRKSGGWFGIAALFGTTTQHYWLGKFVFAPGTTPEIDEIDTEVVAIAQRRWCDGFEIPRNGEGGNNSTVDAAVSRDASRHLDGMGFASRKGSSTSIHFVNTFAGPLSTDPSHWDRFYIRVRKAPTSSARIWESNGGNGNDGIRLEITSGLQIAISELASGTPTLKTVGTISLVLDVWARIDIIMSYAPSIAGTGDYFEVYLNGTAIASGTGTTVTGLGSVGPYLSSTIGSAVASTLECDFDDWIGAAVPAQDSNGRYVGLDWLNGSKVQLLRATEFGTGHNAVDWTNQSYSNMNQMPDNSTAAPITGMVSTTSGAAIVVNTDAGLRVSAHPSSLGIASLVVASYHAGTTSGQHSIGFTINGVLDIALLAATSGITWASHMYRPAGLLTPTIVTTPLSLHYLKDLNASSDVVYNLNAAAEIIGVFGLEDVYPGTTSPTAIPQRALGAHNNPYPESPYARLIAAPPSTYIIHSGTYTGNGTGQDLPFRLPVHWFYTRRTNLSGADPTIWFSSMIGSHANGLGQSVITIAPVQALIDPTFVGAGAEDDQEQRTIVRITGSNLNSNLSGAPYQYVAVCDPTARFMITGSLGHGDSSNPTTDVNLLSNSSFTPEAGWICFEQSFGGNVNDSTYYKGSGYGAGDASNVLSAAIVPNILDFGVGSVTSLPGSCISEQTTVAYAWWRREDGSTDSGRGKVVQIGNYTGTGVNPRNIAFGPIGVRPLWVQVTPHNAISLVRDPADTGTTSHRWDGTQNAATGITAGGTDFFTVSSTLNAIGVIYDWIVLPGGTSACNNGWSCDGEFIPVEPDTPFDGPFPTDTGIEPISPDPDPGDPSTDDPDATDEPITAPDEFDFVSESARSIAIRLSNLLNRVLYRLGDSDQKIWSEDEINRYITEAALEMADRARLVWDQLYLENIPPGFHHTSEFEADLLEYEFQYGYASYNHNWEGQYGFDSELWNEEDVQWAEHTSPADVPLLPGIGIYEQRGTAELPQKLVAIERVAWDERDTPGVQAREVATMDTSYEITQGEMFVFTLEHGNPRVFRKIRIPNTQADVNQHDGTWGIARDTTTAYPTSMTGTWGVPRIVPGYHPMGDTAGYGIPRRFYLDTLNTKVEYWRKFKTANKMSEVVDGVAQRIAGELPRRYFLYIADYCQWKALVRKGPGQDFKLAQLYKDRWERSIQRIINRINRKQKERLSRMGGSNPSPRGSPPRPRLPWQYGSKIR